MSKQPPKDAYQGDGERPPPYSPGRSALRFISPLSFFESYIASLRCQIGEQQATGASLQDLHDTRLLALLISRVEAMLFAVSYVLPHPPLVQTTLIPAGAVTADWAPAETYKDRIGEVYMVGRVQTQPPAEMASDEKRQPTTDVPGAGPSREEHELWWKDGDLARRLAKYLQPASAPAASRSAAVQVEDDVSINVTAEEVTFRRENEMGISESKTGWGVVVRVRVRTEWVPPSTFK